MIRIRTDTTFIVAVTITDTTEKAVANPSSFCAHRFQCLTSAGSVQAQVQASVDGTNWVNLLDDSLTGLAGYQMGLVTGRYTNLRVAVLAATGWTGSIMVEQYGDEKEVIL